MCVYMLYFVCSHDDCCVILHTILKICCCSAAAVCTASVYSLLTVFSVGGGQSFECTWAKELIVSTKWRVITAAHCILLKLWVYKEAPCQQFPFV